MSSDVSDDIIIKSSGVLYIEHAIRYTMHLIKDISMAQIQVISECFVKPKYELQASKQLYHLSPAEIALLSIDPIQQGLLFSLHNINNPSSKTIPHFLENLKNSLSLALVHFYPLAGRFKFPEQHASSFSIDCSKGSGARLIHAASPNLSVSDITSPTDVPTIVRSFFDMGEKTVNFNAHTNPILSIQVTQLQDGFFIGFTMNHSVVDGTSFIHFITTLSEIFNLNDTNNNTIIPNISRVPIFGSKPWIDDKNNSHNEPIILKLPYLEPEQLINHEFEPGPLRERIFHFSRKSLEALKDKVNKECGANNVISSFQALAVLVWKTITLARDLSSEEMTTCSILINTRGRFVPPLSDNCFGNFISRAQWSCKVDELLGHDLGWAAKNIREALMAHDGKRIVDMYKMFVKSRIAVRRRVNGIHCQNCVVFGGSARFDMYGPDFGFGKAVATRMGYANKEDGKVTSNPGRDGGGSVDLEICLKPEYMARLEANSDFMSFVTLG